MPTRRQCANAIRALAIDAIEKSRSGHPGAPLGMADMAEALWRHGFKHNPANPGWMDRDRFVLSNGHASMLLYAVLHLTGYDLSMDDIRNFRQLGSRTPGHPECDVTPGVEMTTGPLGQGISSAVGMALAEKMLATRFNTPEHTVIDHHTYVFLGDGCLMEGVSHEACSLAGVWGLGKLIALYDSNGISIDGKIDGWFTEDVAARYKAYGWQVIGPVDGHDVNHLIKVLRDLKDIKGPKLLHCITVKGKGFKQAEIDQTTWHAPGKFNKETGELIKENKPNTPPKFQDVFGNTILELAHTNSKIVGITPAMPSGCSLNIMMKEMPDRCFDVGIAEQHAVTFSAGLAAQGYVPFCNIYSSFMQRAYDQVIHDVALQKLNVVFCLDRGGLVGADGSTHHGAFDLASFRCIPNMTIASPLNEEELRDMMYTAQLPDQGPFSIRYPRGNGTMVDWRTPFKELTIGKGRCLIEGNDIAILSIGAIGNEALKAIQKTTDRSVAFYDMRFLKPLDEELLHEVFHKFKKIITLEDGTIVGGLGSAVLEFMVDHGYSAKIVRLGIPDHFVEHGTQQQLYHECGYDCESIYQTICSI